MRKDYYSCRIRKLFHPFFERKELRCIFGGRKTSTFPQGGRGKSSFPIFKKKWFVSFPKWKELLFFSRRREPRIFHGWEKSHPCLLVKNNFAPVFEGGKAAPLYSGKRKNPLFFLRWIPFFSPVKNEILCPLKKRERISLSFL